MQTNATLGTAVTVAVGIAVTVAVGIAVTVAVGIAVGIVVEADADGAGVLDGATVFID
jgi:hypothetical protein